ncbi:MAG: alpha/beta fold hydrolase [Balneola sp.]
MTRLIILTAITLFLTTTSVLSQNSLQGIWEGGISVPGGQLKVIFKIDKTGSGYSGTLDIPQQGAKGLRLDPISQIDDSVSLTFKAGSISGVFNGHFDSSTKITGTYGQGGPTTPFTIERTSTTIKDPAKPTNETDLILQNDDIKIGGTLTLPDGDIKAPLLIMSSGSGAQDRDSDIYDFKIFGIIAQHLAKNGIPSFRYDDRGVNKSSGDFSKATVHNLASDVEAIISYFQNNTDHTFQKFALLGHSQGGVVAGKVASENTAVEQLILMGSTAPSLSEILRYQVEFAYSNTPVERALIDDELNARDNLMEAIALNGDVAKAKENYVSAYSTLLNNLPDAQKNSIPNIEAMVVSQSNQLAQIYSSPQMKSLLFYEPTKDLEKLTIPTLVLYGGKDTQVTISQNQDRTKQALENAGKPYEVKIFEEANHLFQKANTGLANEYPLLDKSFVDGFLDYISNWMLSQQ